MKMIVISLLIGIASGWLFYWWCEIPEYYKIPKQEVNRLLIISSISIGLLVSGTALIVMYRNLEFDLKSKYYYNSEK